MSTTRNMYCSDLANVLQISLRRVISAVSQNTIHSLKQISPFTVAVTPKLNTSPPPQPQQIESSYQSNLATAQSLHQTLPGLALLKTPSWVNRDI